MLKRLLLLSIPCLPCVLLAQGAPSMVNPTEAPLKLVSITSTLSDFLHVVTTKNTSNRTISSFQLGVIMAIPQVCGPKEVFDDEQEMRPDKMVLVPGATGQTFDYAFSPKEVGQYQARNFAKAVQTQLAVIRVVFADGGTWSLYRQARTYDESTMAKDGEMQCSNSSKARLARAAVSASCVKKVAFGDEGTQNYSCVGAANQVCQNSADAQSCTASFCAGGCPNQKCQANSGIVPVNETP